MERKIHISLKGVNETMNIKLADDKTITTDEKYYEFYKGEIKKVIQFEVNRIYGKQLNTFEIVLLDQIKDDKQILPNSISKNSLQNAEIRVEYEIKFIIEGEGEKTAKIPVDTLHSNPISRLINNTIYKSLDDATTFTYYVNGMAVNPDSHLPDYALASGTNAYVFLRSKIINDIKIIRNNAVVYPRPKEENKDNKNAEWIPKYIDERMTVEEVAKMQYAHDCPRKEIKYWENIKYFNGEKILDHKDIISNCLTKDKTLTEYLLVRINIANNMTIPLEYSTTLEKIRREFIKKIKLVDGLPILSFPLMDTAEFYYLNKNEKVKLAETDCIYNRLSPFSNSLIAKFKVHFIEEIAKEMYVDVFEDDDIYNSVSKMLLPGRQNMLSLFIFKEKEHNNSN